MLRFRQTVAGLLCLAGAQPGGVPVLGQDAPPAMLELTAAARRAVEQAPALQAAQSVVAGASQGVREARSGWYPSLGIDGSLFQYEEPMIVFPLHELSQTALPAFDQTLVQGSLSLGFTVFDGGIRRGRIGQAEALTTMATSQLAGSEQQVLAQTVRAFVEVLVAARIVGAQEQRLRALEGELVRVERFLGEGRAARVEQLRVEAALAQAKAEGATARSRLEVAERNLARQLALPVELTRADRLRSVRLRSGTLPARDSLLARLSETSPHLRIAHGRVTAAQSAHRAAAGTWYPSLRLEGRLVTYAAGDYSPTTEWQAGLRLSYPLFMGVARSAQVERAAAAVAEAEAGYRDAVLAAGARLDQALAVYSEADERVQALGRAVEQWVEVVRTEALALAEGAGTQTDYLRAEADLALGRASLAQASGARLIARTELALVAGDLSLDILETLVENTP